MGANLKPFGVGVVISGLFVLVAILAMMSESILGGFMLGGLLAWVWAAIVRLAAFAGGGTAFEFTVSPDDPSEPADEVLPPSMPEAPRVSRRASPTTDVEPAISRIIGEDARQRVVLAQAIACRDNSSGHSQPRESENRDFADFLRSGPF